jgi:uncharacterized membrane protein YbhN (UPF0104 family)
VAIECVEYAEFATVAIAPITPPATSPNSDRTWGLSRKIVGLAGLALGLATAAWVLILLTADRDGGHDLGGLAHSTVARAGSLQWPYVAAIAALGTLHYLSSAIAARAAAGIALPLRETVLVQLAAAAANRITPGGLGGSALNARYFTRRGLSAPASLGAVAALGLLGALADLTVLSGLVLGGLWLGLRGGRGEVDLLAHHVAGIVTPLRSTWWWVVLAAAALVATATIIVWRRTGRGLLQWRHFIAPTAALLRRPKRLGTLMGASALTTVALALAFVISTASVTGAQPKASFAGLLVAYWISGAASSAIPLPSSLGATEVALIAVLVTAGVPAGQALAEVLVFRVITFWLPAAVGLLAARRLRQTRAL